MPKRKPVTHFTVSGEPVPKARPRVVNGRTYTPTRTADAEEWVRACYLAAYPGRTPYPRSQNLEVQITAYRKSKRRVDVDNLGKLALDALNTVAWQDDDQVTRLVVEKIQVTENPRTEIKIKERG